MSLDHHRRRVWNSYRGWGRSTTVMEPAVVTGVVKGVAAAGLGQLKLWGVECGAARRWGPGSRLGTGPIFAKYLHVASSGQAVT